MKNKWTGRVWPVWNACELRSISLTWRRWFPGKSLKGHSTVFCNIELVSHTNFFYIFFPSSNATKMWVFFFFHCKRTPPVWNYFTSVLWYTDDSFSSKQKPFAQTEWKNVVCEGFLWGSINAWPHLPMPTSHSYALPWETVSATRSVTHTRNILL